jgi:hypothetical protein
LRKRYIAAQRSARPTAIPIAMPTYAAVESLLGRDASGIGDGLLTDEAVLLGVGVVVMVLDGTILFWVAAPLEIEWNAVADPSSMKTSADELVQQPSGSEAYTS